MSDEMKLKPCPFCGKEMSYKNFFLSDGYPWACSCWGTAHTEEELANVWNARPLEDALLERAEEAEEMVERLIKAGVNVRWLIASAADADVICAMDDFDDLADEWKDRV